MPLGFRAGVLALKTLGMERELNMGKLVFIETGTGHAAGCVADGVQMATGCTFGKGLIERTQYGKFAFTLVDKATSKAVRVSVRPKIMQASFQSPFVQQRRAGVAPTNIPLEISRPIAEKVIGLTDVELFMISAVFNYPLPKQPPAAFNLHICSICGEAVTENKVRMKDNKPICIPCSGYGGYIYC